MTYRLIPTVPTELKDPDPNIAALLALWWYNNPVTPTAIKRSIKIPLPKEPGPTQKIPLENMIFPLQEWTIPYLYDDTFRRIAIFPTLLVTLDYIKLAQYSTLALMYQIPTAQITAGLIIAPSTQSAPLAEILRVGLAVSLIPITFTTK